MEVNKIYQGDCLELMKEIEDKSINMILCDLPYGTTPANWDSRIPMEKLWKEYERIIKDNGAIILTSQQPFTSLLISSNIYLYKYNWIWEKDNATNFLNSKYQPLKITEDICVFGKGSTSFIRSGINMVYNPQFTEGKAYIIKSGNQKPNSAIVRSGKSGREDVGGFLTESDGRRYPKNLIKFNRDKEKLHPTQKPVELGRYLIRTYTNEGDLVLDNTCGVGSFLLSAILEKRDFIGIEINEEYCKIAEERIQKEFSQTKLNSEGIFPPKPKVMGIQNAKLI